MDRQTTITMRNTHIVITNNNGRHTVVFRKNVTPSTWKRWHTLITKTPGLSQTAHSMTAVRNKAQAETPPAPQPTTIIRSYAELATPFDTLETNRARRAESYEKGLKTGQNATEFHISISGVWSTTNRDGSSTFSYERLGYHANTAYFFAGVVASGVKITDYRARA